MSKVRIRMETYGVLDVKDGLRELEKQLVALGANEGRRVLQRAARKAFAPVLEAARAAAPVDSGLTRDNLRISAKRPKGAGAAVVEVGLRVVKSLEKRPSRHGIKGRDGKRVPRVATSPEWRWHFTEGGTANHPAKPFLRPALDRNAQAVTDTFARELEKAVGRALKKRKRVPKGKP